MADETIPAQRTSRWGLAVLIATTVGLLVTGFWRMFGHFPGYDDEGYVLISVRSYLEHGGLYGVVYSQYGPAFYVLLDGLHRLTGVAIDHAFARWFTLALWFAAAGGLGAVVGRATGSRPMAWFTWVAVFLYLHQFSEEAFHPGAVIVALLPALLWALLELQGRGRHAGAAVTAGAGAALLGLLKVNVGVLFAAGCLLWWALAAARGRGARALAVAGGVAVAAALLHGLLEMAWVQVFLAVFAAGLLGLGAVLGAGRRSSGPDAAGQGAPHPRDALRSSRILAAFAAGAAGVTAVVTVLVVARGTSWAALGEGVILGPLRHADAYSFAVDWRPGTLVLAAAALAALAVHRGLVGRGRHEAAARLVVALRVAQLLGLAATLALLGQFRVIGVLFSYALPWLWVWVVPLPGAAPFRQAQGPGQAEGRDGAHGRRPATPLREHRIGEPWRAEGGERGLVACVLLLQALHAYPVGGIQICWGSFPLFALAAMAVPETAAWLDGRTGGRRRVGAVLAGVLVAVAGTKAALTAGEYHGDYAGQAELGLPGTGALRLSGREVAAYHALTANAVLHAEVLFSLPGRFSFNLWSGRPTPTLRNTTLWWSLLDEADQDAVVAALERSRRPAVIVDALLVAIQAESGVAPAGRLYTHLREHYRPAFAVGGLGFWVRAGRPIAPVGTAWRGPEDGELRLCLIGTGAAGEKLVLRDPERPAADRVLGPGNARLTLQAVDRDGRPTAEPREAAWPLRFEGLAWVTVRSDQLRGLPAGPGWTCELHSAAGVVDSAVAVDGAN